METTGFEPMYECFGYTQKHENVSCGMAILLFAHKNPATIRKSMRSWPQIEAYHSTI